MPKRRVLSAEIAHETNTFSVKPTTLESYRERLYYEGEAIAANMGQAKCEIAAHVTAARHFGWELVQPIAARATPSGRTTAEAWAHLKGKLLAACDDGKRFDGVILALHGAMVTEDADDAEGDLLATLRQRIGPDPTVAITLDLHANVSDAMVEHADIILAYRTYPHVDQYEIAAEAALLLQHAMDGAISPSACVARAATIEGCNHGQTQEGVMVRLLARASQYVASEPDVLAVTVCAGFSLADIPFTGPTITVIGDGENPVHRDIADDMIAEVWKTRAEVTVAIHSIDEAIGMARDGADGADGNGPLVIADFSDNPGSGAYGDSVRLLAAMIDAGLPDAALGVICDPDAVRACQAAGVGGEVTLALGSKVDAALYGPPLDVGATVEKLSDGSYVCDGPMLTGEARSMGPTAVLRMGGVRAIVATNNQQVTDRQVFLSQGIDPAQCTVVAVKSAHHFRAAFEPGARAVVLADSGSLAARDLTRFPWKNIRRPVWPLDEF
jgi:microcystin degradation protein MlrC